MRRKLSSTVFLTAFVILAIGGLMQKDGHHFPGGRRAHENYLISLPGTAGYPGNTGYPGNEGPEYAGFRDYIMTMDPETRQIPQKAWLKAARQIQQEQARGTLKSGDLFPWEEIPSNTGGRTRAIMYDPNDPDGSRVWAGAVTGGLWYCEDIRGEDPWVPVNDFWPSLSIACMAYDPNDTRTFYVGTGEGQTAVIIYRESSGRGSGIWKSTDAGQSWELLASTEDFEYVTDIAVRNESGKSVVYAGVISGIYKGSIHPSVRHDGLYRSEDGGQTWTQVLPGIPGENIPYSPAHIEISAAGRIFVGTMRNVFMDGGGRILYSDNGVDWTLVDDFVAQIENSPANRIPGRVILACAPSDANRVYAILSGGTADVASGFVYSRGVMIIRSSDAGASWTHVNMPPPLEGEAEGQWSYLAWHALTAAVQPDNPDVLWVGGLDLHRSVDGGMSWSQLSLWWNFGRNYVPEYPIYVHADQHSLIYRPGSHTELLNSNDGGVFIATDATAGAPRFLEKNPGYNTLQYYSCAIHPEAGKRYFLGGCQDNGTFRTTLLPTTKETSVSYGDGAYCFIDEDEPNIQISSSQFNYYYYSADGNHNDVRYFNIDGGTFINPVDYDHIGNTLYANGMTFEGAYRDRIFRIRRVNDTTLAVQVVPANTGSNVPFSAIHVLPWKENGKTVVLAGSQSGRLYRLDNADSQISSTEIGSTDFPHGYISCVRTGNSADRILVTFSNYGVEHVWETTDGGNNWTDRTGNLPDMPVRWAVYSPGMPDAVLLATELGIWYTLDIREDPVTWQQAGNGFPNVRVDMIRCRRSDGCILAATHGRGLFLSSGPTSLTPPAAPSPEGQLMLYPNPAQDRIHVVIRSHEMGNWVLGIYTSAGQLVREQNCRKTEKEITPAIALDGLKPGSYILRADAGDVHYSQTFIKKE